MPRIVPSQVVSAIDSLFGPSRSELNVDMIRFAHRDGVRTLLSLLRQVPDELITVPFAEYTEYLQCQSSLTSALSVWDVGDQDRPVRSNTGKDPVACIRRILAVCPDENPPPYPDLALISDSVARANVQQDIRAAWIDFRSEEWKGATVFAATALEALLFWVLKGHADVQQPEQLDKQHFGEYVNEAERLGVIVKATADQARLATDARNLIHAGKMARTGLTCTKATALTALAALEAVLGHLRN
jgi:hypothetical protein